MHSKLLNKSTMDKMPGTLLMKDQEEIDAQIAMIVMDQEIVICMGCA
jgi:hypothetical protein